MAVNSKFLAAAPAGAALCMAAASPARFSPAGHRYNLRLQLSDGARKVSKSVLISALHKLDRRGAYREMAYLLRSFFEAVAALGAEAFTAQRMRGNVTQVLNRVAISLFEEGSFNHLAQCDQQQAVSLLLAARRAAEAAAPEWGACGEALVQLCLLREGVMRCRMGSVTKAFAWAAERDAERAPANSLEAAVLAQVNYAKCDEVHDATRSKAAYGWACAAAQRYLPAAARLVDPQGCAAARRFAEKGELRKVVFCAAHCHRLLVAGSTWWQELPPADPLAYVGLCPRAFSYTYLLEIGTVDQHVKGVGSATGRAVFQSTGCRVANTSTHFSLGGLSATQLEQLYVEVSRVRHAAAAKAKAKPKRARTGAPPAAKRARVAAAPTASPPTASPPTASASADARPLAELVTVDVPGGDRILGFKNFTVVGRLTAAGHLRLPQLSERVFVKIGEPLSNLQFTLAACEAQASLGMPSVATALVSLRMDLEWWRGVGAACHAADPTGAELRGGPERTYAKWMNCVLTRYAGTRTSSGAEATALVQSRFAGERLTYVKDDRLLGRCYAESMVQLLLFSKYVGATDLGPFNIMIGADGAVLQVDMGRASDEKLAAYASKGLLTSHRFPARFLAAPRLFARECPGAVERFLERLSVAAGHLTRPGIAMPSAAEVPGLLC